MGCIRAGGGEIVGDEDWEALGDLQKLLPCEDRTVILVDGEDGLTRNNGNRGDVLDPHYLCDSGDSPAQHEPADDFRDISMSDMMKRGDHLSDLYSPTGH